MKAARTESLALRPGARQTENCVGLTGWTTGLPTALRNFQENVASRLTDMAVTEHDVVEAVTRW